MRIGAKLYHIGGAGFSLWGLIFPGNANREIGVPGEKPPQQTEAWTTYLSTGITSRNE
jgi:hypothetical protein